jgi:hypothetical protein
MSETFSLWQASFETSKKQSNKSVDEFERE